MSNSAFTQAQIAIPVSISNGGTGITSVPTNGQLLIGNGTGYTLASITSNGSLTVTGGSGTLALIINLGNANTWAAVQTFSAAVINTPVALSIVSTAIATNAALGNYFTVTLASGATTMSLPTNPVAGQVITYELKQPSSGTGTVTWNAAFNFGTSGSPTLTATVNKIDLVGFRYSGTGSTWNYLGSQLGF